MAVVIKCLKVSYFSRTIAGNSEAIPPKRTLHCLLYLFFVMFCCLYVEHPWFVANEIRPGTAAKFVNIQCLYLTRFMAFLEK